MYPLWQVTHTHVYAHIHASNNLFFITNLLERSASLLLHRLYVGQTDYINIVLTGREHYGNLNMKHV